MTWPYSATGGGTTACELPTAERLTSDAASSSPQLLPTPVNNYPGGTAQRYLERKGREPGGFLCLNMAVELLPTPGAWLGCRPENAYPDPEREASRAHEEGRRGDRSIELPDALALLPTPAARDQKGRSARAAVRTSGRVRTDEDLLLPDVVALLPTPIVGDSRSAGSRNLPGSQA